ncbi:MAG: bifunctional diguanylate cyclase/phosphodiesterase [Stenotrophomonas sp.]
MKVDPGHPIRMVACFGLLIALLLAGALALMLWNDWNSRIAAAQRQSMALATGSDRLLAAELATLERALRGGARDGRMFFEQAPAYTPALLEQSIRGILERNPGLASISLVDDDGRPLGAGRGDRTLESWVIPANRAFSGELYVGRLETADGEKPMVSVAVAIQSGQWLLARVRQTVFQNVVNGLDSGDSGVVSISNRYGQLLAHSKDPSLIERGLPRRMKSLPVADEVQAMGVVTSPLDGTRRIGAVRAPRDYPLMLFAGLGYDEVLVPWWRYLYAAIAIYLLYLTGFTYLLTSMRRSSAHQDLLSGELRKGGSELALAHQVGKVGTWFIDGDGTVLHWSPPTRRMFALDREHTRLETALARVHRDEQPALRQMLGAAWAGTQPLDTEFRIVLPGGAVRWLSVRGEMVAMADGGRRMTGAVVDVSERILSQARAQEAERQFRLVFDRNPAPFWIFDLTTLRFLEVNRAAVELYGYSREEFLSMSILDIRPQEEWDGIREAITGPPDSPIQGPQVRIHRRKDGTVFKVRAHVAELEFAQVPACLVLAEDISEQLAYERELAYRASHHQDTGLLNVRALADLLDSDSRGYTIAHMQLHGLQMINDALGREAGEEVLRTIAARLGGLGARYGLLAYQPAEDFVLAINSKHDPQMALDALLQLVSEPVRGRDFFHQLEPRIGVASCPADGERAEQVIGKAAQAAHAARDSGAAISRFDGRVARQLSERLQLAGRIHSAIDGGEFELHFQPIRHAADGSPAVLEALLRWPQADGSFIPPGDFIQLCEDTGLIIALGRWVIAAAAEAQQQLGQLGWGHLPIAVNVSAVQFFNSDLIGEFSRAIEACGLARGSLHLELTESSLMRNPAQALQTLQQLHQEGICVSLDDFGTGFSSMSYLQHLPLDSLKIDRCFVTDVDSNPRNAAICRALLSLGHSMGLVVIAEGVETEGQYAWLVAHGCDQVQGYLLGRPMPLPALVKLLEASAAFG